MYYLNFAVIGGVPDVDPDELGLVTDPSGGIVIGVIVIGILLWTLMKK